jgi:hypothetical protein
MGIRKSSIVGWLSLIKAPKSTVLMLKVDAEKQGWSRYVAALFLPEAVRFWQWSWRWEPTPAAGLSSV